MKKLIAGFAVVITFAANASSANAEQKGVAGSWTLSAEGYVLKMVLAQSGKKITGTLQGPHGPMPLKGKFARGRITFSGGGPDGIGGREELSATGVLQPAARSSALSRAPHQGTWRGKPFGRPADR